MSHIALRSLRFGLAAGLFGLVCLSALPTQAQVTVYSNDFSASAGSEWSNNAISTSGGESFLASSANGFGNGTVTLTLNGLAPHSAATLNFDLYIIQSWDGDGQQGGGADHWTLAENSNPLLDTTFANFTGGNTQSFVSQANPNGGPVAPRTGAFDNGHLGYGTGDFGDATYRFSYTFADTSPTLVFDFTSLQNQGVGDEGWGLDNVTVSITPTAVPEPGSIALLVGMGVTGAAFLRRRRRVHTVA